MSEEWTTYDDIEDMDSEALATFAEILEKAAERGWAEAKREQVEAAREIEALADAADCYCQRALALEARQEYLLQELAEALNELDHEQTEPYEHPALPGADNHRRWIAEELDAKFGKL